MRSQDFLLCSLFFLQILSLNIDFCFGFPHLKRRNTLYKESQAKEFNLPSMGWGNLKKEKQKNLSKCINVIKKSAKMMLGDKYDERHELVTNGIRKCMESLNKKYDHWIENTLPDPYANYKAPNPPKFIPRDSMIPVHGQSPSLARHSYGNDRERPSRARSHSSYRY